MPQPARSSGRNHHPGRVKFKGFRIRVLRAWGFKGLRALRILGVRILGFKVWPAWMHQPCRSSARNHHPERAGGLKDWGLEGLGFEGFGDLNNCGVLRVWGFKGLAWSDAPASPFFWSEPPSWKG